MKMIYNIIVFFLIVTIATMPRAEAYIDPGSGTMLWQLLVSIGIGILFYIKRFKLWVEKLFTPNKKK